MARPRLQLDSKAIQAWINENLPGPIEAAARKMAGNIETDMPVSVTLVQNQKDGGPVGLVTIAHPGGLASQAKHGTLSRAAAQAGLDVRRYT